MGRRSWRAILPSSPRIARHFVNNPANRFGGCCLAAENNSLLWTVNGLAGILSLAAAGRPWLFNYPCRVVNIVADFEEAPGHGQWESAASPPQASANSRAKSAGSEDAPDGRRSADGQEWRQSVSVGINSLAGTRRAKFPESFFAVMGPHAAKSAHQAA